jgi:outer membrane immunogenic protein
VWHFGYAILAASIVVQLYWSTQTGRSALTTALTRSAENRELEIEMKKLLLGTVGLIALGVAPVSAADLAARPYYTKAAPMMAPAYDWSGFYIGANAGYGQGRDCRTNDTTGLGLGCYNPSGAVAGGQIGYRWEMNSWVFGLEAMGDWADLKGSTQNLGTPLNSIGSRTDAFGLFTGQIGYAWNNVLLYAKGGAAVVDQRFDFVSNITNSVFATTGYDTRWGGTVGAGVEYGFAPNWSVAAEYNHIFLGGQNANFNFVPSGLPLASTYHTGGDIDMGMIKINYRFGGPIVARY